MNYSDELEKTFFRISKKGIAVIATSYKDDISIRPVSVVLYDKKIAFQTSTKLLKYQQIKKNPLVALSVDNISIQSIATIKDHPLKEKTFIDLFKNKHKSSFDNYSHMKSNCVIELKPLKIQRWDYINKEPYIVTLDLKEQTIQKERYQHDLED
ncbi:hypothetical protein IGI37_000235 [Enterococcus sp. AZ194]|uniref:hypothetical protein n=1 Tax=Enterococcus sp. AZ194 TaxID=2774629 RepID=UPI003F217281